MDSALLPPDADLTGRTLGEFRVLRRLGQGGMGQVYLAEQLSLKRQVALKILRADLAANPTSLKRFKAEAEAVARVTHANIVQVYAIGEADGLHFMALEYVEGRNLRDYVARKGPPEVPLALSVMRQVAAALARAAELGIVHRDIKPENILLTRKGEVKVADFGLSRCFSDSAPPLNLTQSGVTLGTPLYMSPEQVQGHAVDPRSDLYSFGVTCYHMLAGQPPFTGETAFEVALHHVQTQPRPLAEVRPDLPAELCAVVDRLMAKKPEDRYPGPRDLLKELTRLRDGLGDAAGRAQFQATPPPPGQPAASGSALTPSVPLAPRRRRRLGWVATAGVLLALGVGAWLGWYRHRPAVQAAEPASKEAVEPLVPDPSAREKFLVNAVREYADPGDDPFRQALGLGHGIELGLLYLDEWRLSDADRFFTELARDNQKVKNYLMLGRLGHAIVLAFQDKAEESNQWFLAAVGDRRALAGAGILLGNIKLRQMIAKALHHNAANGAPIPTQVQFLQRPPGPGFPGGGRPRPGDRS